MRNVKWLALLCCLLMSACLLCGCDSIEAEMEGFLSEALDRFGGDRVPPVETGAPTEAPAAPAETPAPPIQEPAPPVQVTAEPVQSPAPVPYSPDTPEPVQSPAPVPYSPDTPELFSGPGWFTGVMGCQFYVPVDFEQAANDEYMQGMGTHTYIFRNEWMGMEITVFECAAGFLPVDAATEYQMESTRPGVTYATSGRDYYVVSGYYDDGSIYYTRVDYSDAFYHSVSFHYPASVADGGEEVLLEFLRNYSTD